MLSAEAHTAYCPIMSRAQHNNLELNFDTSVCQLKHNAAVCTMLNKKKHDHSRLTDTVYCRVILTTEM